MRQAFHNKLTCLHAIKIRIMTETFYQSIQSADPRYSRTELMHTFFAVIKMKDDSPQ